MGQSGAKDTLSLSWLPADEVEVRFSLARQPGSLQRGSASSSHLPTRVFPTTPFLLRCRVPPLTLWPPREDWWPCCGPTRRCSRLPTSSASHAALRTLSRSGSTTTRARAGAPGWRAAELAPLSPASFRRVLTALRCRRAGPEVMAASVVAYTPPMHTTAPKWPHHACACATASGEQVVAAARASGVAGCVDEQRARRGGRADELRAGHRGCAPGVGERRAGRRHHAWRTNFEQAVSAAQGPSCRRGAQGLSRWRRCGKQQPRDDAAAASPAPSTRQVSNSDSRSLAYVRRNDWEERARMDGNAGTSRMEGSHVN